MYQIDSKGTFLFLYIQIIMEKFGHIKKNTYLCIRKLRQSVQYAWRMLHKSFIINILNKKDKAMIIVPVKDGENIERALKKFKRKFEKTGVVKELRTRQQFNKPSVLKRLKMEHAVYVQKLRQAEED